MDRLKCKACGTYGMIRISVQNDVRVAVCGAEYADTRLYRCLVCGDDWKSVNDTSLLMGTRVGFIHGVETEKRLIRIADVPTGDLTQEGVEGLWQYYIDEDMITSDEWHDLLTKRRKVLKSVVCN